MTLAQIVGLNPGLFYSTDWWKGQNFAHRDHGAVLTMPSDVQLGLDPSDVGYLPYASTLALLYVSNPDAEIWRSFLWTADKDDERNRVYVGGVGIYGIEQFQIHRHLTIDERWGCALLAL